MLITIAEFAKSRNVDRDTVNAFIRNHSEIKKQTQKQGKNIVIDTECEAFALLDKQYPLPTPVQIIEDTESRQKLIKAQELIIQLQSKLLEQAEQIAKAGASLEDKQKQVALIEAENAELKKALEQEKSKTWLQKLLRK